MHQYPTDTNDTAEKYAREKEKKRQGMMNEEEDERTEEEKRRRGVVRVCTQRKEVKVRQERLLRKVECECADTERTPNRLLEVT